MSSARGISLFISAVLAMLSLRPVSTRAQDSDTATMKIGGATIDITLPGDPMKLSRDDLLGWVRGAANAVATYYGRFPVSHLTLKIRSGNGSGIRHGVTYPSGGGLILISVGRETDIAATREDWVLVHAI